MDVGAAALSEDRYHQLITLGYANVTGFEPNPAEYAKLQSRKGPYRYLPVFLGNGAPGRFHFARFPGCSSLLQPNPAVIDMFMTIGCAQPDDNFHVVRTEMVDTVRLDDLDSSITIDYLKIDVQGYELEIMRNGRNKLSNAVVIESEVEFVPLYQNQPLLVTFSVSCAMKVSCYTNLLMLVAARFGHLNRRIPFIQSVNCYGLMQFSSEILRAWTVTVMTAYSKQRLSWI